MKKKYLTYAGIISALILSGMFIAILLSAYTLPFLPPVVTFDPITDASVDENNVMILTGTTTLPFDTYNISLEITADSGSPALGNETGKIRAVFNPVITEVGGGRNRWRGACDISGLRPGDYTVTFTTFVYGKNFTRTEFPPLATAHFTLGEVNAPGDVIHKKTRVISPFIRINPPDPAAGANGTRITGITSLAVDVPLAWSLDAVTDGASTSPQKYEGTTRVTGGTEGINRWAVLPGNGTTEPGRYRFTIHKDTTGAGPSANRVSATKEMDLSQHPNAGSTGQTPGFITIDALPDLWVNDVYIITGTTSLPPDDVLTFMVHPASFETNFNFSLDAKETKENRTLSGAVVFSGIAGAMDIMRGSGGENLWSVQLETYQLSGGLYEINITNDGFDYENGTVIPGNLFSMRTIPIAGERP